MLRRIALLALPLTLAACGTAPVAPASSMEPSSMMSSAPAQASTRINVTDAGFEPSTVTVKPGTTVVFVNTGTKPVWPASAPHPQHTDLPGFDALKGVQPGDSYSFTFTKVGTWKFHNHLKPTSFGAVIVQE